MDESQVHHLLSLESQEAQEKWLKQHAPLPDEELVELLRQESLRRERENPQVARAIASVVHLAADLWQDPKTTAIAFHLEANARYLLAEHKTALALYEKAAATYHQLGLELEAARVAVGQLNTLTYLGLYPQAHELANWAENVFREADDKLALGKMVMNRGNIFGRQRRYQEARASYTEARVIFMSLADERHMAMVNVNDAIMLTELDNFLEAEMMFRQARAYFQAQDMESVVAQVDHNIAYLYLAQGNYQQALATFDRASKIFQSQDNVVEIANINLMRSDIYLALNLWEEACDRAKAAHPAFATANMPWETARLYLNEAAALVRLDNHSSPDEALAQARCIFTQENNTVWLAMTDLYQATFDWRKGNLQSARENAQRAVEIFQESGLCSRVAQCEIILGEVALLEGAYSQAAVHFASGMAYLQEADVPAVSFACLFGLGRTHEYQRQFNQSLTYYRRAIADIERLQAAIGAEDYKIAFLSDKLQVYESLIFLCLYLNTAEAEQEAFETVERAKSRALLDALARETAVLTASDEEATLLADMNRLKRELNWYYNRLNQPQLRNDLLSPEQLADLSDVVTQKERALSQLLKQWRSPDLATTPRNPIWTVTLDQIQSVLPDDTLLLEFYTARNQLVVFGITATCMWSRKLAVSTDEIGEYLSQLRFQMNKFSYGPQYRERHAQALQESTNDSLHKLYKVLLLPIQQKLTASTLIIVPHGLLHYVPFQALYNGERYLLEDKTVSYAPSATILYQVLTNCPDRVTGRPLVVGLSDATIPHAQTEAQAIASLFPQATLRLGDEATLDTLQTSEKRPMFIHLSTHATFRADNPLFSALRLTDGWLSVYDIYNMDVTVPLVTLSACETGRNQVAVGDELVGLCRGFFAAGTQSLVVSLWMVDDASTTELMTHFYQNLQSGLPVNQALRSAQLLAKEERLHPYYWAPFILTGNVRTRIDY